MQSLIKLPGFTLCLSLAFFLGSCKRHPEANVKTDFKGLTIQINAAEEHQTIRNFGASDAWSCQFVGKNWPEAKKNQVADLLFSMETSSDGSPKGIGLSAWRFNIGAGSTAQGESSGISDEWRRAETFLNADGSYDWTRQAGERWFMKAAKERGIEQFVAFVNSPPVLLTKNGKAHSSGGNSTNLKPENYGQFAGYISDVIQGIQKQEGIDFNIISPVNEPQWEWKGGQEGSPFLNEEIFKVVKALDSSFVKRGIATKVEISEAGKLSHLVEANTRESPRDQQIKAFFDPASPSFVGNFSTLSNAIVGHSYFTTWPLADMIRLRREVSHQLKTTRSGAEFVMSEYTLLEDNAEIKGGGRDLGIKPALYLARVAHFDLTVANAAAWQWWLAVSPYDYKDGLVYIDKDKNDGRVLESKMLWAMGNYSRFVRPGMIRVGTSRSDNMPDEQTVNHVMTSAFIDKAQSKVVVVAINYSQSEKEISLKFNGLPGNAVVKAMRRYVTSGITQDNLRLEDNLALNATVKLPPAPWLLILSILSNLVQRSKVDRSCLIKLQLIAPIHLLMNWFGKHFKACPPRSGGPRFHTASV